MHEERHNASSGLKERLRSRRYNAHRNTQLLENKTELIMELTIQQLCLKQRCSDNGVSSNTAQTAATQHTRKLAKQLRQYTQHKKNISATQHESNRSYQIPRHNSSLEAGCTHCYVKALINSFKARSSRLDQKGSSNLNQSSTRPEIATSSSRYFSEISSSALLLVQNWYRNVGLEDGFPTAIPQLQADRPISADLESIRRTMLPADYVYSATDQLGVQAGTNPSINQHAAFPHSWYMLIQLSIPEQIKLTDQHHTRSDIPTQYTGYMVETSHNHRSDYALTSSRTPSSYLKLTQLRSDPKADTSLDKQHGMLPLTANAHQQITPVAAHAPSSVDVLWFRRNSSEDLGQLLPDLTNEIAHNSRPIHAPVSSCRATCFAKPVLHHQLSLKLTYPSNTIRAATPPGYTKTYQIALESLSKSSHYSTWRNSDQHASYLTA
ncbi:receptor-like protein 12 [Dorcoceras hygrometricum]|uniref:Receptor-like protein 12 n=1 Tax=Dorcoceras hygrometricum TaxID=472368 RepID=A0A2Z7CW69_9LAMI|nr:receptor-like protein 12 [Dorcoceras hygrometricum]